MAKNSISAMPGYRLGTDINFKRSNNVVLENSIMFTMTKQEKIDLDVAVGMYLTQDPNNIPTMHIIIETKIDEKTTSPYIDYSTDQNTGTMSIFLYNFTKDKFNNLKIDAGGAATLTKKVGEMNNTDIIAELIAWPSLNNKNKIACGLNIYSKTTE